VSYAADFRVFLRCEIDLPQGQVAVETVAAYGVEGESANYLKDPEVLIAYVNDVAVMACLPFVRQALSGLTQRVFDSPLVMPVRPRGAVRFDPMLLEADLPAGAPGEE